MLKASTSHHIASLCDYVAHARQASLPEAVAEKAKHHVLDTFAALVTGVDLPVGRIAIAYCRAQGGAPTASVAGTDFLTSTVNAALANGMIAHADETDDSHPAAIGHPGCVVVPAALAAAEQVGASGADLLRAVVLGYDLYARVNLALGPREIYDRGHGPYSIGGAWGAAAAAGLLLDIPRDRLPYLFSNVAQQTSGIATWMRDADHIEKAFHFGGMPARNGVSAATMVAAGFTGLDDVLNGRGNFMDAFSTQPDRDVLIDGLGTRFEITLTNIKKWCVGSPIQAVLDSLEWLMKNEGVTGDQVEEVRVHMPPGVIDVVIDRGMSDISCPFCVALMLVDGRFTFKDSHDPQRMRDPAVLAMKEKVSLVPSETLRNAKPIRQAIVEVHLLDGRRLSHRTYAVKGVYEDPLDRPEVAAKAEDLMAPVLGAGPCRAMIERVFALDRVPDVRDFRSFLQRT